MASKVFVFLPQTDEAIVPIVESKLTFEAFIDLLAESVSMINAKNQAKLFYDKANVSAFFEKCSDWDDGVYLDSAREKMYTFFGRQSLEITENIESLRIRTNLYLIWNMTDFYLGKTPKIAPPLVIEAAERLFHFPEESVLILNFNNAIPTDRPTLLVFKDELDLQNPQPQDPPLPNSFAHIPVALAKQELLDWLESFGTQIGQLKVSPNHIQTLIKRDQTESVFKRLDSPKILGEQLHMHFKDDDESALNIDGSWKHGNYNIPAAAKDKLREWGFIVP
jgi:hypothetical protein